MLKISPKDFPQYRYQKTVQAIEISKVVGNMAFPLDEQYSPIAVDEKFLQKHSVQQVGYLVVYLDGNKSFYPKDIFEQDFCLAKNS